MPPKKTEVKKTKDSGASSKKSGTSMKKETAGSRNNSGKSVASSSNLDDEYDELNNMFEDKSKKAMVEGKKSKNPGKQKELVKQPEREGKASNIWWRTKNNNDGDDELPDFEEQEFKTRRDDRVMQYKNVKNVLGENKPKNNNQGKMGSSEKYAQEIERLRNEEKEKKKKKDADNIAADGVLVKADDIKKIKLSSNRGNRRHVDLNDDELDYLEAREINRGQTIESTSDDFENSIGRFIIPQKMRKMVTRRECLEKMRRGEGPPSYVCLQNMKMAPPVSPRLRAKIAAQEDFQKRRTQGHHICEGFGVCPGRSMKWFDDVKLLLEEFVYLREKAGKKSTPTWDDFRAYWIEHHCAALVNFSQHEEYDEAWQLLTSMVYPYLKDPKLQIGAVYCMAAMYYAQTLLHQLPLMITEYYAAFIYQMVQKVPEIRPIYLRLMRDGGIQRTVFDINHKYWTTEKGYWCRKIAITASGNARGQLTSTKFKRNNESGESIRSTALYQGDTIEVGGQIYEVNAGVQPLTFTIGNSQYGLPNKHVAPQVAANTGDMKPLHDMLTESPTVSPILGPKAAPGVLEDDKASSVAESSATSAGLNVNAPPTAKQLSQYNETGLMKDVIRIDASLPFLQNDLDPASLVNPFTGDEYSTSSIEYRSCLDLVKKMRAEQDKNHQQSGLNHQIAASGGMKVQPTYNIISSLSSGTADIANTAGALGSGKNAAGDMFAGNVFENFADEDFEMPAGSMDQFKELGNKSVSTMKSGVKAPKAKPESKKRKKGDSDDDLFAED